MNKMFTENPCAKRHGSGDHPGPLMFLLGFAQRILENFIVFFPSKNLQLVYPPYDMARLMRIPMPNAVFWGALEVPFNNRRCLLPPPVPSQPPPGPPQSKTIQVLKRAACREIS